MKNQNSIIIIILIVLAGLGFYLVSSNSPSTDSEMADTSTTISAEESMMEKTDPTMVESKMMAPETATTYMLTDSTVSYSVQKRFFQKEDDVVTGTTNNVIGEGWYDSETNSFYLEAALDFDDLETDSPKRDDDILPLFSDTAIEVIVRADEEEGVVMGQEFNLELPVMLVINGVERSEIFDVTGTLTEEGFTASGTTSILMSDFNVNPPSLIEVFSVDDEMEISFEVSGIAKETNAMENDTTVEEDDMMEETN